MMAPMIGKRECESRAPDSGLTVWIKRTGIVGGLLGSLGGTVFGAGVVWGVLTTRINAAEDSIAAAAADRAAMRQAIEEQDARLARQGETLSSVDAKLELMLKFWKIEE